MPPHAPYADLPPLSESEIATLWQRARDVPISTTLGFEFVSLARGECTLAWNRDPAYDGIFRSMHGGLMMTLADSAGAFALLTLVDPDSRITTTEMNIRFMAPVRERVVAHARVLKAGRSLSTIVVDLVDAAGRPVAHAGMTYRRLGRE
ncbi:MAG: PaaI family thioesterase [Candidatus Eisenbacteria bacterium]